MNLGLDGKTVVAGGARGSGLEIGQRLAREGARSVASIALVQHARDRRLPDPAGKGLSRYRAAGLLRGLCRSRAAKTLGAAVRPGRTRHLLVRRGIVLCERRSDPNRRRTDTVIVLAMGDHFLLDSLSRPDRVDVTRALV